MRDHARKRTHPNLDNEVISQQLEDLVIRPASNRKATNHASTSHEQRSNAPTSNKTLLFLSINVKLKKEDNKFIVKNSYGIFWFGQKSHHDFP